MDKGRKIVLVSKSGYSDKHEPFLRKLIEERIELLSVVGPDCQEWEDAMDWLCVELDTSGELPGAFCNTTSHPGESVEEVINFAKAWSKGGSSEVEVIEI